MAIEPTLPISGPQSASRSASFLPALLTEWLAQWLAVGLILGLRVASLIFHVDDVTPSDPINLGFFPLFALLAGWAFCTDCQLPPGRMPIGLFTSLVGAVFSLFVIPLLGDMAGTLLGGLVLGLISNLYARLFKPHISLTALIPGTFARPTASMRRCYYSLLIG